METSMNGKNQENIWESERLPQPVLLSLSAMEWKRQLDESAADRKNLLGRNYRRWEARNRFAPRVMVYLMTGFLDSGKSRFLKAALQQPYFQIDGRTLLILCEEGEEEYDASEFAKFGVKIITVEEETDLTEEWLKKLEEEYAPDRVIVEYNGMWKVSGFEAMKLPEGWGIAQKVTLVDATTFEMYMKNLRPLFIEMVKNSELVVFNRCTDMGPLSGYRRSIKVASPQAEVLFENQKGEINRIFEGEVPYDYHASVIQIEKEDFGIWYVDMMDHRDRYDGRIVETTARVIKPKRFAPNSFLHGRMALTCCADDTTFLGYLCKYDQIDRIQSGEWLKIRAKIGFQNMGIYGGVGPMLEVICAESAQPIPELVYFS